MNKEKWSDDRKQSFIKNYINHPALWNVKDPNYAIKSKKEESYRALMKEFGLSMIEVKNKIRIYRTTYGQELKKMENSNGSSSKLLWFDDLHKAFHQGKIKSFTKSASKRGRRVQNESKVIQIEYEEEEDTVDSDKKSEDKYEIKKIDKADSRGRESSIIIEPYYEYEEDENFKEDSVEPQTKHTSNQESSVNNTPASSFAGSGMQSNELFLKSLQSTLDKLPDAKNMRARIKIQEILYQIAYDVDK